MQILTGIVWLPCICCIAVIACWAVWSLMNAHPFELPSGVLKIKIKCIVPERPSGDTPAAGFTLIWCILQWARTFQTFVLYHLLTVISKAFQRKVFDLPPYLNCHPFLAFDFPFSYHQSKNLLANAKIIGPMKPV